MSKTTETEEALEAAEAPETTEAETTEAGTTEAGKPEEGKADLEKADPEKDEAEAGKPEPKASVKADAKESDAEESAEDGAAPVAKTAARDDEPARGLRDRLNGGVVGVVALVLLVASLVASAFLWTSYSEASGELSVQKQVRTRSAEFTRSFLLYDKADLDGWEKRLTALAAPDYRSAISQSVKMQFPVIETFEASSQVTIRDVFLNDFDGSVAKAVVVADSRVTSKDFVRTATGMRLLVELNRIKGEWLISGVGVLGIDNEVMTDADGKEIDPSKIEVPEVVPSTTP